MEEAILEVAHAIKALGVIITLIGTGIVVAILLKG